MYCFLRRLQLADQLRRREEEHPQTRTTRRLAQGHGDVRLARSVAPDKTTIVLVFNPFASRQLQDLGLGKLRQDAEVVGVEVLQHRELRVLDPRRHRVGSAGLQLDLGQAEQKLDEGLIGRGGVVRQPLELLAHRRQPQLPEMGPQQLDRDIGHRCIPFYEVPADRRIRARRSIPVTDHHGGSAQAKNTATGPSADGSEHCIGIISSVDDLWFSGVPRNWS